jgi:radical SAM superfamily enzyme YgiQ (UPF0313 family)
MKKRVLLLNTPFYRLMGSHYNGLSLGLLYIAAVLREHGHEVAVLNADYENRSDYLDQRGIFSGFDTYRTIHETYNHHIWDETVRDILKFDPDLLGITMYSANFKAAKIIAGKVKKINTEIKTVVGGVHPTLAPEKTLQEKEFDYLVRGEGEIPLLELLGNKSEESIAGLGYKRDDDMFINTISEPLADLDALPFPARDLIINADVYTDYGQLITGRGCPFSCTYCASPAMWGRKNVRFRSVANVIEEILIIKKNYPHNIIYFEDDTFTLRRGRIKELCKEIVKRGIDIKWKCDTRADCLTEEMVILMKAAGCVCVKMGVESGSEKILKKINKRVNKDTILNASRIVKKHDIPLTVYLMAGFPDETNEDLQETIQFAKEIDATYYSLSIVVPYFGTKIYDEFVKRDGNPGKEQWEYFFHQSWEMIVNDKLSKDIIDEFLSLNDGRTRI